MSEVTSGHSKSKDDLSYVIVASWLSLWLKSLIIG